MMVTMTSACATLSPRIDPQLYEAKTFALVSVHARTSIDFRMNAAAPLMELNELGLEALEMELGEGEVRLGEVLGAPMVPPGKVLQEAKRAYDALPEATPPEAWTQVNGMTAVDLDDPRAVPALGGVARALGVDAAVVVRHEWSLVRDRFELGEGATLFDRCTILVVDKNGRPLWSEAVLARMPVMPLLGTDFSGAMGVGLNGATWGDEALQHARRTAKMALDELGRRYEAGRKQHGDRERSSRSASRPATAEPPPVLEPAEPGDQPGDQPGDEPKGVVSP